MVSRGEASPRAAIASAIRRSPFDNHPPLRTHLLSVQNLLFQYGNHTIFKDFSVEIPASSLCLAPNGSGKTTLLKLIAHILEPQSGSITYCDKKSFTASIFLSHSILFDNITVQSHLAWIQSFSHQPTSWLEAYIEQFQLFPLLNSTPSELSSGQRQWLAIVMTCLMPADVYLLDEPLNSLDDEKIHCFAQFLNKAINHNRFFILTGHQNSHQILHKLTGLETISITAP